MEITFKNIANKPFIFTVNPDDEISSLIPQLYEAGKTTPKEKEIKIIHQGKVLENNIKFSTFQDEKKPTFVFMFTKVKVPPTPINTPETTPPTSQPSTPEKIEAKSSIQPQTVSVPTPAQTPVQVSTPAPPQPYVEPPSLFTEPVEDFTEFDEEVDRMRAGLIGLISAIKSSPELSGLFNTNPTALYSVLMSNQFKPLFENIVRGMNEADGEEQSNYQTLGDALNGNRNNNNNQPHQVVLDQNDMNNIEILIGMGFPKNACVQAYVMANKNLDLAASLLMDM